MSANASVLSIGALEIRPKLGEALPGWRYIHTHFGFGYRFEPERSHPFHNAATAS